MTSKPEKIEQEIIREGCVPPVRSGVWSSGVWFWRGYGPGDEYGQAGYGPRGFGPGYKYGQAGYGPGGDMVQGTSMVKRDMVLGAWSRGWYSQVGYGPGGYGLGDEYGQVGYGPEGV